LDIWYRMFAGVAKAKMSYDGLSISPYVSRLSAV